MMRAGLLVALVFGLGCDSDAVEDVILDVGVADSSVPLEDVGVDVPDVAGPPRVRFFVDTRPHDPENDEVETTSARYTDPIRVVVNGLAAGDRATVRTTGNGATSWAVFDVVDGTIDLARDAPIEGTWSEADTDAFIWSMALPANPPRTLDLTLRVAVEMDGDEIASGELTRPFVNEGVVVQPINDGTRVGTLVLPEGDGPFPGVLVFGGSEGGSGSGTFDAYLLAQLGYAAFGVAYFGEGPALPETLSSVPLEVLEDDLAFLAEQPQVDAARLGVMGGSRGGELALLLGAYLPDVRAVVAAVPSGYVWPGGAGLRLTAAWTWNDEPLRYVPPADRDVSEVRVDDDGARHITGTPAFEAAVDEATRAELTAATIPVEDIQGPVLLYAGDDDKLWPSCALARVAMDRLIDSGHTEQYDDVLSCFANAGHAITAPGWSTEGSAEAYSPGLGAWLVLGGSNAGNGRAGRAANTQVRALFESALGGP